PARTNFAPEPCGSAEPPASGTCARWLSSWEATPPGGGEPGRKAQPVGQEAVMPRPARVSFVRRLRIPAGLAPTEKERQLSVSEMPSDAYPAVEVLTSVQSP